MIWVVVAILCYTEEPDLCVREAIGSAYSRGMCEAARVAAHKYPPSGRFIKDRKSSACLSGHEVP